MFDDTIILLIFSIYYTSGVSVAAITNRGM